MTRKSTFIPKYEKVKQAILHDIRSGKLNSGDKLPTREELVVKYQATRTTLDKALSSLIQDNILTASRRHGTFVASRKNLQKIAIITWLDSINKHKTKLWDSHNYFSLYYTLQEKLQDRNFELINPEDALANPAQLKEYDFLLSGALSEIEINKLSDFMGSKDRFILLNRDYDGYKFSSANHSKSCQKLTELFFKYLPQQSAFYFLNVITTQEWHQTVLRERKKGFINACEKHRRFYRILDVEVSASPYFLPEVSEFANISKPDNNPVCIISPTSFITGAVARFAAENGFTLNKNLFYADFDNQNSIINTGYALPSVLENFSAIATTALDIMDNDAPSQYAPCSIINTPFVKTKDNSSTLNRKQLELV